MKAAIVKASTLARHKTWSARYYLGGYVSETREALSRAEQRLVEEQGRVARLQGELQQEDARLASMRNAGEVVPL